MKEFISTCISFVYPDYESHCYLPSDLLFLVLEYLYKGEIGFSSYLNAVFKDIENFSQITYYHNNILCHKYYIFNGHHILTDTQYSVNSKHCGKISSIINYDNEGKKHGKEIYYGLGVASDVIRYYNHGNKDGVWREGETITIYDNGILVAEIYDLEKCKELVAKHNLFS